MRERSGTDDAVADEGNGRHVTGRRRERVGLNKYRLGLGYALMQDQPLRGFVILVVEDDPDTLNAVAYLIVEAFGCRVLRASSVDYALRMIDSGSRVDLVFSDVGMPEIDGLTFAELVRRRRPDLPFVLVTGRPDVVDASLKAGWVALLKPYTAETLEAVFTEQLRVNRPSVQ